MKWLTIFLIALFAFTVLGESAQAGGGFVNVRVSNNRPLFPILNAALQGVGARTQARRSALLGVPRGSNINVRVNSFGSRAFFPASANVFVNSGIPVFHPSTTVSINGFAPNSFGRFNAFGTATTVDQFGNVFESDAFGNTVFRGSAFRGFGVSAPSSTFFVRSTGLQPTFSTFATTSCGFNGCATVRGFGCH